MRDRPKQELILDIVTEHTHSQKSLDEWVKLINSGVPSQKKMTSRSIALWLNILYRQGKYCLNKTIVCGNIFYEFT